MESLGKAKVLINGESVEGTLSLDKNWELWFFTSYCMGGSIGTGCGKIDRSMVIESEFGIEKLSPSKQ